MNAPIGSVLFVDIVRYSTRSSKVQERLIRALWDAANGSLRILGGSGSLADPIVLPTGDGMGIVFPGDACAAIRCAELLATHTAPIPDLEIRMGVDSGHYIVCEDITGRKNAAGTTINRAQRVMNCGGAGHILCSDHYARELIGYDTSYSPKLSELPPRTVKHGQQIVVWNYHDPEHDVGNPNPPDWVDPVVIERPGDGSQVGPGADGWTRSGPSDRLSIYVMVAGRVTEAVDARAITLARLVPGRDGRRLYWCARARVDGGRFTERIWCGFDGEVRAHPTVEVVAVALGPPAASMFTRLHSVANRIYMTLEKEEAYKDTPLFKAVQQGVGLWAPAETEVLDGVSYARAKFTLTGLDG